MQPEAEALDVVPVPGGDAVEPVEDDMLGKEYLAGDFTAADTMLGHSLLMAERMQIVNDSHPNLKAYTARLKARPAAVG